MNKILDLEARYHKITLQLIKSTKFTDRDKEELESELGIKK